MNGWLIHWNLAVAWILVLAGFVSGALLGLGFHREDWLGGYASHKRRLYRLGHISFFGLALINLLFYFTVRDFAAAGAGVGAAGCGFVVGAVTMPICCLIMAHKPALKPLFAIPVASLLVAAVITAWKVVKP